MNLDEAKLSIILQLWRDLSEFEFDESGRLIESFIHFPKGTHMQIVYDWFDCRYPGGCMELDAIIERK